MVRVLFIKAQKEDKHYSNENENTDESDESDEYKEPEYYDDEE